MPIPVTDRISLDESELSFEFVRSTGPGGQNVNKVATSVRLRFDARNSPSLPADVRERLIRLAGKRVDESGVLAIVAREHRTQDANRRAAVERLVDLITRAAHRQKSRRATRPTRASQVRRLESKARRSATKRGRRTSGEE
jgi:ribosome-associated protein